MACNGNNHELDCDCGWGGIWRGKFSSSDHENGTFTLNAKCPVCSQPVYYYQNSRGSKVFFDEIGHPWPKHPCTINKECEKKIVSSSIVWIDKNKSDVERSTLYKHKYSVKHDGRKVPFLFFFTNIDLEKAINIKVSIQVKEILVRIYIFIDEYKQFCILEGPAYTKHPSPGILKKLKVIKLGKNKISYLFTSAKNSNKNESPKEVCILCRSIVSKKNMTKHIRKAHGVP